MDKGSYQHYPLAKRLTEDEELAVMNVMDFHVPTHHSARAAYNKFGKYLSTMDANNLRSRMISPNNSEYQWLIEYISGRAGRSDIVAITETWLREGSKILQMMPREFEAICQQQPDGRKG